MHEHKTREELIQDLTALGQRIDELEKQNEAASHELAELQDSESRFRLMTHNMTELICVADLEGRILYTSPSHETILGYGFEERIGQSIFELLHPDDIDHVRVAVKKCVDTGRPDKCEYRILHNDGIYIWLETMGKHFLNENEKTLGLMLTSRDITERKKMEETLRASENLYRTIFESTGTAIAMIEEDMTVSLVNSEFEKMTGYSRTEVEGRKWTELIATVDVVKMMHFHEMRRTEPDSVPESYEFSYIDKSGNLRYALLTGAVIPETTKTVVSAIDTTIKKKTEEDLRNSNEKYRLLVNNVKQAIFVAQDGMLKFTNPRMHEISGYTLEDFSGKPFIEFIHPEDREMVIENHLKRLRGEDVPAVYEFRVTDKEGNVLWVELSVVLFTWNNRPATLNFLNDITERKRAEEALRESEQRLKTILEGSPIPTFAIDKNHAVTHWNKALEELSGIKARDAIGSRKPWWAFYEDDRPCMADLLVDESFDEIQRWYKGKHHKSASITDAYYATDFFPALGEKGRWLRLTAAALRDFDGNVFGAIETLEDITERKLAEEALKESERKYRDFVELLPQTVFELDLEGNITAVNHYGFKAFGYSYEDFQSGTDAFDLIVSEERARGLQHFEQILQGEAKEIGLEYTAMRKDGTTFPIILYTTPILEEGRPVGIRGIAADITERKHLESQLLQAQKMEAVGTLAGGIAHDFNNLLMGIQGYTSLILLELAPDHPHYEKLKNIESQVKSGADLTKQLLGFARGGRYETKPVNINEIAAKSAAIFGRTKKDIPLHAKYQDDVWTVKADQSQIEQILVNLYVNAWQAMPAGGEMYLETRNVLLQDHTATLLDIAPGKYVMISVADTGMGMDRATMERIFEPFFTTKGMGRGTGLGLASVYGIVKGHGGAITVRSGKDDGTTFYIYLPASEEPIKKGKKPAEKIMRGGETLLLVDDEEMIIEVTRTILENLGYRVFVARNGKEAVDLYGERSHEIDLVILDVIMPVMAGGPAFDALKEINPEIKVLLSSGYSIDGEASKIMERGCKAFIQKPFILAELSQKLREVLEKA